MLLLAALSRDDRSFPEAPAMPDDPNLYFHTDGRLREQDLGPPEVWSVTMQWPEAPKPRADRAWRRAQRKRGGR
jgi:hypothetical protein